MALVERIIEMDACGYREVSLAYRIARAARLDGSPAVARTGRIACPGLDTSRSALAYGCCALPGTKAADLDAWSDALGLNRLGIKTVAYLSGPFWSTPLAFLRGRFDDRAVNTGFLRSLKRRTNTGILTTTTFNQERLNGFVWSARPDLVGREMTGAWLYSTAADCEYIDRTMVPAILTHNAANTDARAGWLSRRLGLFLSSFEMTSLLLGTLAQPIRPNANDTSHPVDAISLRDLHDFYKYGLFPAVAEERLSVAGLLSFPPVHMTPA